MKSQKDKAEELVRKYYTWGINKEGQTLTWFQAKELALIAVDELIQDNYNNENIVNGGLNSQYWKEVKQEIQKL